MQAAECEDRRSDSVCRCEGVLAHDAVFELPCGGRGSSGSQFHQCRHAIKDGEQVLSQVGHISQDKHYRELEAELRSTHVATLTLSPEISEYMKKLKQPSPSLDDMRGCAERLTAWRNALRAGKTMDIEDVLAAAVGKVIASPEVVEVLNIACALPTNVTLTSKGVNNSQYEALLSMLSKANQMHMEQAVQARQAACKVALDDFIKACKGNQVNGDVILKLHASLATVIEHKDEDEDIKIAVTSLPSYLRNCVEAGLVNVLESSRNGDTDGSTQDVITSMQIGRLCKFSEAQSLWEPHHKLVEQCVQIQSMDLVSNMGGQQFLKLGTGLISSLDLCKKAVNSEQGGGKAFEIVQQSVETALGHLREQIAASSKNLLDGAIESIATIVGGVPDDGSWKAGLPQDAPWKDVVAAAKPLFDGRCASLSTGFKQLKQELRGSGFTCTILGVGPRRRMLITCSGSSHCETVLPSLLVSFE